MKRGHLIRRQIEINGREHHGTQPGQFPMTILAVFGVLEIGSSISRRRREAVVDRVRIIGSDCGGWDGGIGDGRGWEFGFSDIGECRSSCSAKYGGVHTGVCFSESDASLTRPIMIAAGMGSIAIDTGNACPLFPGRIAAAAVVVFVFVFVGAIVDQTGLCH